MEREIHQHYPLEKKEWKNQPVISLVEQENRVKPCHHSHVLDFNLGVKFQFISIKTVEIFPLDIKFLKNSW